MRYFNLAGECNPVEHYMLPAVERLPGALVWVERRQYFIVHAPRQTGKTTTLTALARELTQEGKHVALKFSCERGESGPDEIGTTELLVLDAIRTAAVGRGFPKEWMPPDPWPAATPGSRIVEGLQEWAVQCPLPLVLFFDEIDSLSGAPLNSVLRQLRDGFSWRGDAFPVSVALCGMRQLRDYKIAAGSDEPVRSGRASPFNNALTPPRIADFTADEVAALYGQHSADTGQKFTPEAVARAFEYTQGQPWLVNALASVIVDEMRIPLTQPVTAAHVDEAKDRVIRARPTHLDSLAVRLAEPRVRRVIEPILAGTLPPADAAYDDDVSYAQDLGLIAPGDDLRIANPIYQETIARVFTARIERAITADPHSLVLPDGQLDIPRMLEDFTAFWTENGEWLAKGTGYNEAGAQLVFMAFLHRAVNGNGIVDREFAIGSGRVDLLVRRWYGDGEVQRAAFELKVWWEGRSDPLREALMQFDGYLDRFRLETGTLIIFDRRKAPAPVSERITTMTVESPAGRAITLLRR